MINDENTSSISKGCFFFPAKNVKNHKTKRNDSKSEILGKEIWCEMEEVVDNIHEELQKQLFQQLTRLMEIENNKFLKEERKKIPTAVVITGVNMPDHENLYASLDKNVKEISSQIIHLQSKTCFNMKMLMKIFASQLKFTETSDEIGTEKRSLITMSTIEDLYIQKSSSPSPKKKKKQQTMEPLVVVFEDFEAFSPKLIHDFIFTASFHASKINFFFIFGISTSWDEVSQRQLAHSSLSHLSIIKFQAPIPSKHLSLIFDKILLTQDFPFKLSGKCLQLLVDVFLCYDFSINNFIRSLKFCVMEHYRKQPASILCQLSVEESTSLISEMKDQDLKIFFNLPSVEQHVNSVRKAGKKKLLTMKDKKKLLVEMITRIYNFHDNYFVTIKCLSSISRQLPYLPLGKQLRELFCLSYSKSLEEVSGFSIAFNYFKVSGRNELITYLNKMIDIFDTYDDLVDECDQTEFSLKNVKNKLNSFLQKLTEDEDQDYYESDEYEKEDEVVEKMNNVRYTYQLQQKLRERSAIKKTKKRKTKFEKLRDEIMIYLKQFFVTNLQPPPSLPLHEAFYFNSIFSMRQKLTPCPRLTIQTALSDPYHYLQVAELTNNHYITSSLPDISIVYQLHLESSSFINIYDWMKAFHAIISSDDEVEEDIDEITQARFIQAVSELQLLGFIKSSKKLDHVQRLTY